METKQTKWWLALVKGIILILLAFYVFFNPVAALVKLTFIAGLLLMLTGLSLIIMAMGNRKLLPNWGLYLAEGVVDVLFAFVLMTNPGITAAVLPFVIGFWMMFLGIISFVDAIQSGGSNKMMRMLGGLVTIVIGYLVSGNLVIGALTITFWIGLGLLMAGLVNVIVAMKLRKG